ncbi:Uncharacterized protein TCM_013932 [Theobroma cacao]|uniref:Uncharacterized protein n=1 Tax=Theobroma cacao TaxID=3641 RepID=A0A061G445_THECC|nr:Uncharacterized protein TCM_013932 [Theobroma cacao]
MKSDGSSSSSPELAGSGGIIRDAFGEMITGYHMRAHSHFFIEEMRSSSQNRKPHKKHPSTPNLAAQVYNPSGGIIVMGYWLSLLSWILSGLISDLSVPSEELSHEI